MCLGNNSDGDAANARMQAAITRQQMEDDAAAREQKIRTGQGRIDAAFSAFDPAYFDKFKADYTAANTPDVENQYGMAKDKLTAALADRGVLSSTIAGNAFGQLDKTRNDALATIAGQAGDAATAYRGNVEKQKSDLYSLNTAASDPDAIGARATGEATALVAPPPTTALGDIFSSVLSPLVNYTKASMFSPTGKGFSFAPTSGSGNGKLVA